MKRRNELQKMYDLLDGHFGALHWWPADHFFEVMIGAILTQNTSWSNAERVIMKLRERGLLDPAAIFGADDEELSLILKPSGCFRRKTRSLKQLVIFLFERYGGCLEAMHGENLSTLRDGLMALPGIGPETADSILLYACQKPVFVVDAYARRILERHGLHGKAGCTKLQRLFMDNLPHQVQLFNQFHALIVTVGKGFCRRKPLCAGCPLASWQPDQPPVIHTGRKQGWV
jgi:endonuclease-3 related protein